MIAAVLARNDASSEQVAESIVSTWREIDVALRPILGQRGVVLLYKRSLNLVGPAHTWLASLHDPSHETMDLAALDAAFSQQGSAQAATAGGVLLQTFHQLLSSLIGPSLTEQLLRPVWVDFSGGPSAQDTIT